MWKNCDFERVWNRYQYCVIFGYFLSCVHGVFNSAVATPAHGLHGLSLSLRLRFILENASLLVLYICASTHFTKLLTWALFIGPCHQWRSQPKFFWGGKFEGGPKCFTLGEQQYFCLGRRFSKRKMIRYAKNCGEAVHPQFLARATPAKN